LQQSDPISQEQRPNQDWTGAGAECPASITQRLRFGGRSRIAPQTSAASLLCLKSLKKIKGSGSILHAASVISGTGRSSIFVPYGKSGSSMRGYRELGKKGKKCRIQCERGGELSFTGPHFFVALNRGKED